MDSWNPLLTAMWHLKVLLGSAGCSQGLRSEFCAICRFQTTCRGHHMQPYTRWVVTILMLHRAAMRKINMHVEVVQWRPNDVRLLM